MFFLDPHSELILLFALILLGLGFWIRAKNRSKSKIVFIFAMYAMVMFCLHMINESFSFIAIVLLPFVSLLVGYLQKRKDKVVSKFFYRFATFSIVICIIGLGVCASFV